MLQVSVIGPSVATNKEKEIAYKIGEIIGELGFILITGGRGGIMEAASCGALKKNGITVGMLPQDFNDANPCVKIKIPTFMNELRNFLVVSSSHLVISVGISEGTLIELAIAHKLRKPVYSFLLPHKYSFLSTKSFDPKEIDQIINILLNYAHKIKP